MTDNREQVQEMKLAAAREVVDGALLVVISQDDKVGLTALFELASLWSREYVAMDPLVKELYRFWVYGQQVSARFHTPVSVVPLYTGAFEPRASWRLPAVTSAHLVGPQGALVSVAGVEEARGVLLAVRGEVGLRKVRVLQVTQEEEQLDWHQLSLADVLDDESSERVASSTGLPVHMLHRINELDSEPATRKYADSRIPDYMATRIDGMPTTPEGKFSLLESDLYQNKFGDMVNAWGRYVRLNEFQFPRFVAVVGGNVHNFREFVTETIRPALLEDSPIYGVTDSLPELFNPLSGSSFTNAEVVPMDKFLPNRNAGKFDASGRVFVVEYSKDTLNMIRNSSFMSAMVVMWFRTHDDAARMLGMKKLPPLILENTDVFVHIKPSAGYVYWGPLANATSDYYFAGVGSPTQDKHANVSQAPLVSVAHQVGTVQNLLDLPDIDWVFGNSEKKYALAYSNAAAVDMLAALGQVGGACLALEIAGDSLFYTRFIELYRSLRGDPTAAELRSNRALQEDTQGQTELLGLVLDAQEMKIPVNYVGHNLLAFKVPSYVTTELKQQISFFREKASILLLVDTPDHVNEIAASLKFTGEVNPKLVPSVYVNLKPDQEAAEAVDLMLTSIAKKYSEEESVPEQ